MQVYSLVQHQDVPVFVRPRLVPNLSHGEWLEGLAISRDGSVVATVGADGAILLWDRAAGRMFRHIPGDQGPLISIDPRFAVTLSPDGAQVMSNRHHSAFPAAFVIWDVATGMPQHVYESRQYSFADISLLDGGDRALVCSTSRCTLEAPGRGPEHATIKYIGDQGIERYLDQVSVSPDGSAAAFMYDIEGSVQQYIAWVELTGDRQWTYRVPERVQLVRSISTLGDERVLISAIDGEGPLLLLLDGKTAQTLRGPPLASVVALDNDRLAGFRDDRDEMLILSSRDFSILHRVAAASPLGSGFERPLWLFPRVSVSGDGRWLVAASSSGQTRVWDTITGSASPLMNSDTIPAQRIEFDTNNALLLVDGDEIASLWNLSQGRVARQFHHHSENTNWKRRVFATLIGDTVVYLSPRTRDAHESFIESWSLRYGLRTVSSNKLYSGGIQGGTYADGTRTVATSVRSTGDLYGPTEVMLLPIGDGDSLVHIDPGWRHSPITWHFDASSGIVLIDLDHQGLEAVRSSDGESIWRRDDMFDEHYANIEQMMLTNDRTGVVVTATISEGYNGEATDDWLLVLDAETGETRFILKDGWDKLPVVGDDVVHALVRMDFERISVLSIDDGLAAYSVHESGMSARFAIADRQGDYFLVAGQDSGVLWDTSSGEVVKFPFAASSRVQVSFSPDGRLLASVERDGTVALRRISSDPLRVEPLAQLIMFSDGDWAVVTTDGRYDASDPADLEALSWVMPDAPTEPVPLALFFREYYEPQILARLLAGEELPLISPLVDLDRTQPVVEITGVNSATGGHVSVSVKVTKSGARGVGDVKLFRDGQLVAIKEGTDQSELESAASWQVVFDDIALPTTGVTEVEFSAYAFNADGVKSDTDRFRYGLPEGDSNSRRAFVIVVGVNAYENRSWDLDYSVADAIATREIVARHLEASESFERVHTVTLIAERDESSGEIVGNAARADLFAVLDVLAGEIGDRDRLQLIPGAEYLDKVSPDDVLYLGFSGHGLAGDDGVFHLFMSDIGEGGDRVVNDELLSRTVGSDMLERRLRAIDAAELVMVIDACNAAAIVEGKGFKPGPMGSRGLGQLAYDKAMRVLTASQADGVARQHGGIKHSLLSFAVLRDGLENGRADRAPEDQRIGFSEMLSYGVERVPVLYDEFYSNRDTALAAFSSPPPLQQPRLFDFSRSKQDVRFPVID